MKRVDVLRAVYFDPMVAIVWLFAFTALLGGLLLLTPALSLASAPSGSAAAAIYAVVTSLTGILVLSLCSMASGVFMMLGLIRKNWRMVGIAIFTNLMIRLYAIVASFLIFGWDITATTGITAFLVLFIIRLVIIARVEVESDD